MRYEMRMPDLATNDTPVRIVRWLKSAGQAIRRGEPLLEAETDKATVEVESFRDGVILEVRLSEGQTASAGEVIAVLEV